MTLAHTSSLQTCRTLKYNLYSLFPTDLNFWEEDWSLSSMFIYLWNFCTCTMLCFTPNLFQICTHWEHETCFRAILWRFLQNFNNMCCDALNKWNSKYIVYRFCWKWQLHICRWLKFQNTSVISSKFLPWVFENQLSSGWLRMKHFEEERASTPEQLSSSWSIFEDNVLQIWWRPTIGSNNAMILQMKKVL